MQEQNCEKIIALTVNAAKMDANVLKKMISHFINNQKNIKPAVHKGKQSIKRLVRGSGSASITNIEITDKNIKAFDRTARKFGIDYALKKDSSEEPPKYTVFFKAKDSEVMTAAFKDFLNKTQKKEKKVPIRAKLAVLKRQLNKHRIKQRVKEKAREESR